ncbi:glycoside hydrolase domain-containing protein [Micromonospora sp. M12]
MTVHRSSGDIVVNAPNNSTANVYVQDVKVNGKKQRGLSVDVAALARGGTIDFQMGPKPSSWGSGKNDAPPSLTKGDEVPKPLQDVTGPGLGTATATGGQDASKLFDDSSTTQLTFTSATPQISWAFRGGKQKPKYYTVTSGAAAGDPASWRLQGSNDGITWTSVDSRTDQAFPWRNQTRPYAIDRPGRFAQFRLAVTKTVGAAQTNLAEIELLAGATSTSAAATSRSPPRRAFARRLAYPCRCRWRPSPAAPRPATRPRSTGVTARRSPRAP